MVRGGARCGAVRCGAVRRCAGRCRAGRGHNLSALVLKASAGIALARAPRALRVAARAQLVQHPRLARRGLLRRAPRRRGLLLRARELSLEPQSLVLPRRVRLVREEGRGVSSQYGTEGKGGGSRPADGGQPLYKPSPAAQRAAGAASGPVRACVHVCVFPGRGQVRACCGARASILCLSSSM